MAHADMPIFTRTFDFLAWLLPTSNNFPRAHRHTLTRRLLDAAFDLREQLEEANQKRVGRSAHLMAADVALGKVRLYVRLASRFGWLTQGQYEHAAGMTAEIGRLLGGWHKATAN